MERNTQNGSLPKAAWRAPKVEDLGNLREFVRTGGANGKSGPDADGNAMLGGEAMVHS